MEDWGSRPPHPLSLPTRIRDTREARSCALTHEGSTSYTVAFMAAPASPKGSGSPGLPRRIGELSNADAPPGFPRPSGCGSGGFRRSGRMSVATQTIEKQAWKTGTWKSRPPGPLRVSLPTMIHDTRDEHGDIQLVDIEISEVRPSKPQANLQK